MAEKKTSPAENEANNAETVTFTVDINGKEIKLEAPVDLMSADPDAYIAYEERKFGLMMKLILNPQQWNRLRAAQMTTQQLLEVVMPAYQEAAGLGED